jgi:hypothetical protein
MLVPNLISGWMKSKGAGRGRKLSYLMRVVCLDGVAFPEVSKGGRCRCISGSEDWRRWMLSLFPVVLAGISRFTYCVDHV